MEGDDFKTALEGALQFFPGIKLEREQELCLESLLVKRKDVLGVLPTGYGKSLIYQLLPKVLSQYWFQARNQDFMWEGANEAKVDQTSEMHFLFNSF